MLNNHLHHLQQEHQPPRERVLFNKPFHNKIHFLKVAAKVVFRFETAKWLELHCSEVGAVTDMAKTVSPF